MVAESMAGGHPDCRDAMHRLYHYLDGELDDSRRAMIQRHLDQCLPCLGAFDFEAELRMVIASKCRERVPDSLRASVMRALQAGFDRSDPAEFGIDFA